MHGSLPNEDQLKVFQRPEKGYRKVVINSSQNNSDFMMVIYFSYLIFRC